MPQNYLYNKAAPETTQRSSTEGGRPSDYYTMEPAGAGMEARVRDSSPLARQAIMAFSKQYQDLEQGGQILPAGYARALGEIVPTLIAGVEKGQISKTEAKRLLDKWTGDPYQIPFAMYKKDIPAPYLRRFEDLTDSQGNPGVPLGQEETLMSLADHGRNLFDMATRSLPEGKSSGLTLAPIEGQFMLTKPEPRTDPGSYPDSSSAEAAARGLNRVRAVTKKVTSKK